LSNTKVKYKTTSEVTKYAIWIRQLLQDIKQFQIVATIFNCYNQSCRTLFHDHMFHVCTKHIKIQYHYICEVMKKGTIKLQCCKFNENIAHIFTKALTKNNHQYFVSQLSVTTIKFFSTTFQIFISSFIIIF
jgi:hypothetical protein